MRNIIFIILMLFGVVVFSQKQCNVQQKQCNAPKWILITQWKKANLPNNDTEIHFRCWKWSKSDQYGKYTYLYQFQSGSIYNGFYRNTGFNNLKFYYKDVLFYTVEHGIVDVQSVFQVYIFVSDGDAKDDLMWKMEKTWIN